MRTYFSVPFALFCGLSLFATAAGASPIIAAPPIIAYDNTVGGWFQNFGGSLGLDFAVTSPIKVTAMGAYDNGDRNNLNGTSGNTGITVMIYQQGAEGWSIVPGSQVLLTPTSAYTQINGNAFVNVTPFFLLPGQYSVVTWNDTNTNTQGADNSYSTTNTGGGAIVFNGTARWDYQAGIFPTTGDTGPFNRYNAGTFQFEVVPEPASFVLMGAGLLGFAPIRRRA
jgi:hypothetical protein